MSFYWDERFKRHLDDSVETIVEVGARFGCESIELTKQFPRSIVYSFECNPVTVEFCRKRLEPYGSRIKFFGMGLGEREETLPFFSYLVDENHGASSLFKRIDFDRTQRETGRVEIKRLDKVCVENGISKIDLLCMDVQGYELNVLKGCGEFLENNVRYVIMEEPKPVIQREYLPEGVHSKYIGSPTSLEIKEFMSSKNFVEIERVEENGIEDNVMYLNTRLE